MKRIITMLVALVATICLAPGAMAELDTSKCYYLKDTGVNKYVVIPATAGTSNYITPSTTDKTPVAFKAVTGGYSMQSATSEVYIGVDSWNAVGSTVAQAWEITEVEGGITIKNISEVYNGKWFGGQTGKTKFYNNNDNAITFTLEVAEGVNPPTSEPAAETRVNVMGAYLKNLSGDYFGTNGNDVGIVSEPFAWNLEYVVGAPKAYTIKGVTLARWINSGSNGYLSTADNKSNARSFYFYEVGEGTTGTLVEQPVAGKKYIVAVANIKDGVKGLYALYGQVVATNTARMDVIKIQDGEVTISNLPETIDLSTHATTVAGVATDNNKAIWQIKLPAKQVVTGTDDSVITEGWYQIQVGSGSGQDQAKYKDYYMTSKVQVYNSNNWIGLTNNVNDLNTYVYISGTHDAFDIQYNRGGTGSTAVGTYYANFNTVKSTTATGSIRFVPNTDGTEWHIAGYGNSRTYDWCGWTLGGPALGSSSNGSLAQNYFKLTKVNELPEVAAPQVGKSYRIAILRSDGTKKYIKGTSVTDNAFEADVLTMGESGVSGYPMTFVTAEGNYLTNQGVRSGMSGNKIAFKGGSLRSANSSYVQCSNVIKDATYYLTAKERHNSNQEGSILLKEADNSYDNANLPFMNGAHTSALLFEEVTDKDYTLVIPEGVTVTIGGTPYTDGSKYTCASLDASLFVANAPEGFKAVMNVDEANQTITFTVQGVAITALSQVVRGQVYTITAGGTRGSFILDGTQLNSTAKKGVAYNEADANQQFAFIEHDGKYYFFSVGGEKFVKVTGQNTNNARTTLTDYPENNTLEFLASTHSCKTTNPVVLNIDGHHVGVSGGFTPAVITHYNSTGDEGNSLAIRPVYGVTLSTSVLEAAEAACANCLSNVQALAPYFENAGAVFALTETAKASLQSEYETLCGQTFVSETDYNAFKTKMDAAEKVALTTGYYRLVNNAYSTRTNTASVAGTYDACSAQENVQNDLGAIALVTVENEGKITISYQGKFVHLNGDGGTSTLTTAEEEITHFAVVDEGGYCSIGIEGDGYGWLHSGSGRGYGLCAWTDAKGANASGWVLVPAESIDITLTDLSAHRTAKVGEGDYWTTLYVPFNFTTDEATIYGTEEEGNYLHVTKLTEAAKGEGYVLNAEQGTATLSIVQPADETATSASVLTGTYMAAARTESVTTYVFSCVEGELGFYKFEGDNLAANKAYFVPAVSQEVQGFVLDFGGITTGISNVNADVNANLSFDLQGRRVNKATRGLFIHNGVKVIK